jgi:hypothetical protein
LIVHAAQKFPCDRCGRRRVCSARSHVRLHANRRSEANTRKAAVWRPLGHTSTENALPSGPYQYGRDLSDLPHRPHARPYVRSQGAIARAQAEDDKDQKRNQAAA